MPIYIYSLDDANDIIVLKGLYYYVHRKVSILHFTRKPFFAQISESHHITLTN